MEALITGQLIGDRYRLLAKIGSGGAANVFQVKDEQSGALRALKILSAVDPERSQHLDRRLRTEARLLADLAHPNVLPIYDIGTHQGRTWLVTELAECNLLVRIRSSPTEPMVIVSWMLQVLSALALAHEAGVVHRDVKPQNILLSSQSRAMLADFGIAMVKDPDRRETHIGVSMGSSKFMAPEQRQDARSVDHRADIYSAGCTLFYLLTGVNPSDLFIEGPDTPRLAALSPALRSVVLRATRYKPADRYPSARGMAAALAGVLTEEEDGLPVLGDAYIALNQLGPAFDQAPTVLNNPPAVAPPPPTNASSVPAHPADEADRLASLFALAVLDTEAEERFDRHTRLVRKLLDVPIALISLIDRDRQWFKSCQGLDVQENPRERAFCAHAILNPDQLLEVPDTTVDPRFQHSPMVTGQPNIRFYAGLSIRGPGDQPVGTLCIVDRVPRTLSDEQRALMKDIAGMVEAELTAEQRASVDRETGLSNLAGFVAHTKRVLALHPRQGRPITLILFTLASADSSARRFASGLLETWEDAEVLARVGWAEFCVIASGDVNATARAQQLQRLVPAAPDGAPSFRWASVTLDPSSKAPVAALIAQGEAALNRHLEAPGYGAQMR